MSSLSSLKIVHLSVTPVAGAPMRMVSLLRKHTAHEVRLIDLKRGPLFDHDLVYDEAREESEGLIEGADILHFHNHVDFDAIFSLRLEDLRGRGVKVVRHFHSDPFMVSKITGKPVDEILAADVPTTVIAQFQERYYPRAHVVPNVLLSEHSEYLPSDVAATNDVFYGPSMEASAWSARWNTKGMPETRRILGHLRRALGCRIQVMQGRPLREVMKEKQRSRIIIDDLVTGGYHLSGLEGLSQGKAVLTYLDNRTDLVLRQTLGADQHPFINVRLEDARTVLTRLLQDPGLAEEIGRNSRAWVEKYWSELTVVGHYLKVYEDLLQDETRIRRQDALRLDDRVGGYFAIGLPDAIQAARKERYFAALTTFDRVALLGLSVFKWLRGKVRYCVPESLLLRYRKLRGG